MPLIEKFYWALNRKDYESGACKGTYRTEWPKNLELRPLPNELHQLKPRMERLSKKWHWSAQPRYNDAALSEKLAQPGTELFGLYDTSEAIGEIGYALASKPNASLRVRFWPSKMNVMEVDNLGLYPGYEGGGRGKAFFEMLFDRLFVDNDAVFWSQHNTHNPTLPRFYKDKMGMSLLATDTIEDFRPHDSSTCTYSAI